MTSSHDLAASSGIRGYVAALQRAADIVAVSAAWAAGLCIAALTLLVLTDTLLAFVSRYLISSAPSGTGIGWEYSAYLMGSAFVLGAGLTLRAGLQLRVEVLIAAGGVFWARCLELVSCLLGSFITVTLAVWLFRFTLRNYGFGDVSQDSFTPLWIPQSVLTLGVSVLAFQMIARLLTCVTGGAVNRPELGAATAIE
jgi:TRAP-type mannitol/chloroaromatic compound transport system permease small subunit